MVLGRLGMRAGSQFGKCPESLAEEFGLHAVGSGESLKDEARK